MFKWLCSACFVISFQVCFAQDLAYYLPTNVTYSNSIPKPKDIIHHEVGEWHITHDRLANYMKAIAAAAPDRVKLEIIGYTFESRQQMLLIFSAKKNLGRLEEIRQQHLLLSNPAKAASVNTADMPIVVYIGHSIHGNESSGSNAALLSAYYLAAAQGKAVDDILDNTVILFDPSFNPDGLQRFSTWANQHKSKNLVTDPNSREFNEVWPGGRYNHYWFDLNRDWLPAVHVESQNRLKWFYAWKPNILTDHHEQGTNASFFFQPGVPSRVNPLTPQKNQVLSEKLGRFHARNLEKIGSLYFSKENYDDFYYGKGSTFPDINGGIGILFEQASSRGHAQQSANGVLRFPATIRNQFVTALSTLEGAVALRKDFLDFQKEFYLQSAVADNNGYIFSDKNDKAKAFYFIQMLQRHGIEVRQLAATFKDEKFDASNSYAVALNQPQKVLIKAIFDKQLQFKDSLFYDITTWTMPLAFGLNYKEAVLAGITGKVIPPVEFPNGEVVGNNTNYAYAFEWNELYAPRALHDLQQAGLITKVATNGFTINTAIGVKKFGYGSILIPVQMQSMDAEKLSSLIQQTAKSNALQIFALQNGAAIEGSDLGSSKFISLTKPSIALLVGQGVNPLDAGEVWHLLDQRMNIPASHIETATFNRIELTNYNTIIMVSGEYNNLNKEKLKAWVQAGGNLILLEEAITWAQQNGINNVTLKKVGLAADSSMRLPYIQQEQISGAQAMSGAIFEAQVDNTHPLAYGYTSKTASMFKANKVFMDKSKNPFATPFYFGENPLQSGWASTQNLKAVKNSASVIVNAVGAGRVINIADNPNFRGFWLGGTKLMLNAIFFGKVIDAASARVE
jgi:Zinc carboxypeptidase